MTDETRKAHEDRRREIAHVRRLLVERDAKLREVQALLTDALNELSQVRGQLVVRDALLRSFAGAE